MSKSAAPTPSTLTLRELGRKASAVESTANTGRAAIVAALHYQYPAMAGIAALPVGDEGRTPTAWIAALSDTQWEEFRSGALIHWASLSKDRVHGFSREQALACDFRKESRTMDEPTKSAVQGIRTAGSKYASNIVRALALLAVGGKPPAKRSVNLTLGEWLAKLADEVSKRSAVAKKNGDKSVTPAAILKVLAALRDAK